MYSIRNTWLTTLLTDKVRFQLHYFFKQLLILLIGSVQVFLNILIFAFYLGKFRFIIIDVRRTQTGFQTGFTFLQAGHLAFYL